MNKLKQARTAAGLTQKQVAERVGIIESQYKKYELKMQTPSVTKAIKIAKSLSVDVGDSFVELFSSD